MASLHLAAPDRCRRSPRAAARVPAWAAAGALAALALSACGHSASSAATAQARACTSIAAVLSDGPDPGADPVGYAEAQVLPLRQLKITDPALRHAVLDLAAAYQAYANSTTAVATGDKQRVTKAENALNRICPGAAQ